MINVAIIDDGVNENEIKIDYNWEIDHDLNVHNIKFLKRINFESHGTICAKIIKKYLINNHIIFHSIQAFDYYSGIGLIDQFIKSLEYCLTLDINVLNLSLGTNNTKSLNKIEVAINKIFENKTIIIAAENNDNTITYPAALQNVIGVSTNHTLTNNEYFYNDPIKDYNIEITASSDHLLQSVKGYYKTPIATSFATPLITSNVINYLTSNPNLTLLDIKTKLKEGAKNHGRFQ